MKVVHKFIKDTVSDVTYCHRSRTTAKTMLKDIPATDEHVRKIREKIENKFSIALPAFTPANAISDMIGATLSCKHKREQELRQARSKNKYASHWK